VEAKRRTQKVSVRIEDAQVSVASFGAKLITKVKILEITGN